MSYLTKTDIRAELNAEGLTPSDITLDRWIAKFGLQPMNQHTRPRRYPRGEVNKLRRALGLTAVLREPRRPGILDMEALRSAKPRRAAR